MTARRGYGCKLTVRVSDVERRRLAQEARRAGLSVSRYLAESGLRGCPPPSVEERAQRQRAIFHAKKIGTNLNQIAHQLNADGVVPPVELREALAATTQALARLAGKAGEGT
jgi:sugar phosphate isomerase/epimerase